MSTYRSRSRMNNVLLSYWDLFSTVLRYPIIKDTTVNASRIRYNVEDEQFKEHIKEQAVILGDTANLILLEENPRLATNQTLPLHESIAPGLHSTLANNINNRHFLNLR